MLKILIAPVQRWMLARSLCVGCGTDLKLGKRTRFKKNQDKITCACGRIFIHSVQENKYRRALMEEIDE